MNDNYANVRDIERLDSKNGNQDADIKTNEQAIRRIEGHWNLTKILFGIFGVTATVVLCALLWAVTTASNAKRDLEDAAKLAVKDTKTQIDRYVTAVLSDPIPEGTIMPFAGPLVNLDGHSNYPDGWLPCDGRALQGSDPAYASLFAIIGQHWGNGTEGALAVPPRTNFNLPDLRGRFLRGVDAGTSRDPGPREALFGGSSSSSVGSYQQYATAQPLINPFKTANRNETVTYEQPNHLHEYVFKTGSGESGSLVRPAARNLGDHTHNVIGGDQETRPTNVGVTWLIWVGISELDTEDSAE